MAISAQQIKELREKTQAGFSDCKMALEEAGGDMKVAEEILRKKGFEKAAKKSDRETKSGLVESYVHGGRIGVLVSLLCETDFVARTDEFKALAHEIALQVSSMDPKDVTALLKQEYIRDSSKTIEDLVKETIAKVGENIQIGEFKRSEI